MKTADQLQTALALKEKQLAEAQTKLSDIDVWIAANNVFGTEDHTFLEKLLTEKIGLRERKLQLETQIQFLEWVML